MPNDAYHAATEDLICVAMTSNLKDEPHSFVLTNAELADGNLNRPSRVRADKIFTLAQGIIAARFGRVDAPTLDRIRQMIADVMW